MTAAARMRMSASRVANHVLFVGNVGAVNSAQASGSTLVVTVGAGGIPAGHTIISRSAADYLSTAPTIADTRGNTWTSVRSSPGPSNAFRASMHAGQITTALQAGDTITMTWASSLTNRALVLDRFSGLLVPLTVDAQNGSSGTSTTPDANVTSTTPVDLVVGMVGSAAPLTDGYTQDATWTGLTRTGTQAGTAPYVSVGGAYRLATSTSTWHYKPVLGTSVAWAGIAAAFKAT